MTPRVLGSFARMTRGWRVSGPWRGSAVRHGFWMPKLGVVESGICGGKIGGSSQELVHVSIGIEGRKRPNIRHIPDSKSPFYWTSNSCLEERWLDGKGAAHANLLANTEKVSLAERRTRLAISGWTTPRDRSAAQIVHTFLRGTK